MHFEEFGGPNGPIMVDQSRGIFFINTQVNPNEQWKAIITRSGKKVGCTDGEREVVARVS